MLKRVIVSVEKLRKNRPNGFNVLINLNVEVAIGIIFNVVALLIPPITTFKTFNLSVLIAKELLPKINKLILIKELRKTDLSFCFMNFINIYLNIIILV